MKITLSKKKRGEKRHIVLVCSAEEQQEIFGPIWNEVLQRDRMPVMERLRNGNVRYRFAMRYLDRLMLTFPFADFSIGLEQRLSAQAREELQAIPVPDIELGQEWRGELYDFQKIVVDRIVRRSRFIVNDEQGLGKTYMVMASIVACAAYPTLAVCTNSIKYNWQRIAAQVTDLQVSVLDGTAAQRKAIIQAGDYDMLVINSEAMRVKRWSETVDESTNEELAFTEYKFYEFQHPDLFFNDSPDWEQKRVVREDELEQQDWRKWPMAVVDEYHHYKNPDAQQTIGLHFIQAHRKVTLSGTPVLNGRPEELWSVLHWMWPRRFPDYSSIALSGRSSSPSRDASHRTSDFGVSSLMKWTEPSHINTFAPTG